MNPKTLLTAKDLAAYLNNSPKTIYRWVAEGKIPFVSAGLRLKRFDLEAVLAHFEKERLASRSRHLLPVPPRRSLKTSENGPSGSNESEE